MNEQASVFICGAHKSGTTLLRSLLDGHSELMTIPFETHFFRAYGQWVDNDYKFHWPASNDVDAHHEALTRMLEKRNSGSRQFSDTAFSSHLDLEKFDALWNDRSSNTLQGRWAAFNSFLSDQLNTNATISVEKSVENAEMASMIAAEFPNARFVHISRNPYANMVALREFRRKNYTYPLLPRAIRTLYNNFYFAYRNEQILGSRMLHIHFEDLIQAPEQTMQKVSEFIGIEFQDILLRPTSMNRDWSGNSTSEEAFKGIDTAPLHNYKKKLSGIEIEYVNRAMGPVLNRFGYEQLEGRNYWLPGKGEGLARYIFNRMYLPYLKRYDKPI
jgi:hypothetical protein